MTKIDSRADELVLDLQDIGVEVLDVFENANYNPVAYSLSGSLATILEEKDEKIIDIEEAVSSRIEDSVCIVGYIDGQLQITVNWLHEDGSLPPVPGPPEGE